ncbi:hypothetical protein TNCT_246831 [Trichonephila clavata]|uniref:Renin receptor n=1 Tax=Trichonephila clavata TaxID=2740835 RepID=A0A8X6F8D2_TRICU|nr:hypothetical protein TNCT_246831 [Trichonephila clavata]
MAFSVFRSFSQFLVLLISLFYFSGAVEEVVVIYAPESIKFLSEESVRSSYLGDIFSSMFGYTIRSNIEWHSLAEVSPWKRPEALVVLELHGFDTKVDLPLEGTKFLLENVGDLSNQYDLTAHRTNERFFGKSPVMLHMDLSDEEARIREARHKEVKEARLRAEEEAWHIAEEARLKAEKEAKILEARWRIEKEAQLRAEEEARLEAQEEARLEAQEEARLKAQEDAKAVEERRKAQRRKENERKNNFVWEEETRLEKEKWLVQEQMQQVQEKHKMRMKAEKQKCLQEERCKRMEEQKQFLKQKSDEDMEVPQAIEKVLVFKGERAQMLSVNLDAVAQPVIVGKGKGLFRDSSKVPLIPADNEMCEGKEETSVNVIRDKVKDDINPAIFSKETLDLEDDEIEEEKSKLFKRKLKKLRRKTVAELQQKVNLKASSNIILVLHHWCFKGKQDKPAWKLLDFIKRVGIMKMGQALLESNDQKTMKAKMWKKEETIVYYGNPYLLFANNCTVVYLHDAKIAQPVLLKSVPADPKKRLQMALNDPELGELVKESTFNITLKSDETLLTELATIKEFLKALSAHKSEIRDGTPDIYWLKISGLEPIVSVYGQDSFQFREALRLLRQIIAEVKSTMRNIYDDNLVISVIKTNSITLPLGHKGRKLLEASSTETPVVVNTYNLAPEYDPMFPIVFAMLLFVSLLLILSLLGVSMAMWNMDPGKDSIIYRMTSQRMKKD